MIPAPHPHSPGPRLELVAGFGDAGDVRLTCQLLRLRRRHSLVLVDNAADDYAEIADVVVRCDDIFSPTAVTEALNPFRGRLGRVMGVPDRLWASVCASAHRLGAEWPNYAGELNARIKPRMRRRLARVAPTRTRVVSCESLGEGGLSALLADVGLPLVVKPIWGQASSHVEIVTDEARVRAALEEAFRNVAQDPVLAPFHDGERLWDPRSELLVEEFLGGREYSVEGVVSAGAVQPLLIQEKHRFVSRHGFRFETCNLSPPPFLEAEGEAEIRRATRAAISALGLDDCPFHVELKWDGAKVSIIEVNPRMGGGSVPRMLGFWYDTTVRHWPVAFRLGEPQQVPSAGRDGFLMGVFVNAERGGYMHAVEGLEWVRSLPGFAFDTLYLSPGQLIREPGTASGARDEWLYAYDAFFWLRDPDRIEPLYQAVRERVQVVLADRLFPETPAATVAVSCSR